MNNTSKLNRKYFLYIFIFVIIAGISSILLIKNSESKIIKIGLVAGLSGKYSGLGSNIKEGFHLALGEINYEINGHKIQVIQKDDKQNPEENQKVIHELIDEDVHLIVGNGTSSMTKVTLDILKDYPGILLFSPTASSIEFEKKDDNFIRNQVTNNPSRFITLAKFFEQEGYENIVTFYDPNNENFSKSFIQSVEKIVVDKGGKPFLEMISIELPYEEIVKKLSSYKIDLLLFSTNGIDTTSIIQYLKLNRVNIPIFSSDWAKSSSFIEDGGKAVEDVLFYSSYDNYSEDEAYLKFVDLYQKTYKQQPSLFVFQSYEAAKIIIETLKKDIDIKKLKTNILKQKIFKSLQGNIVFDSYGDVQREQFMLKVINGEYRRF